MSKRAGDPLRKVTLNLYEADVRYLEGLGWGWTETVREWVHRSINQLKQVRAEDERD